MEHTTLSEQLLQDACLTEDKLRELLSSNDAGLAPLFEAMNYSLFAGGKRIRPFLVLAFSRLFGGDREAALSYAAAIEMVHTYSLIHDDLPCMDDDDLRRGRPTNHKVFGEANAVLAGDALLTLAFETIAGAPTAPALALLAVSILSRAAGCRGMVGGQIMDMAAETTPPDLSTLRRLQSLKTGALIIAAAELGCLSAGITGGERMEAARTYAGAIGRAFQITDDILDAYGSTEALGKQTGQDARDGKTTYLSFLSREEAYAAAREESECAKAALASYDSAQTLTELADYLLNRNH